MVTKEELAYWAGFIDGEGSICIIKSVSLPKRYKNSRYQITLQASNTNREIMEKMLETFGGSLLIRDRHEKDKISYEWKASSLKAVWILKRLLPYFKVKKSQAELAIKFQELMKKPGYQFAISNDEIKSREDLRMQMLSLNKRGR